MDDEQLIQRLRRVASLSGLMAIVLFGVHVLLASEAIHGRHAFIQIGERLQWVSWGLIVTGVTHFVAALRVATYDRIHEVAYPYRDTAVRRVQSVVRYFAMAFALLFFAASIYVKFASADPAGFYDWMWVYIGRPVPMALTLVGLTSLAYYVFQGGVAAARLWGVNTESGLVSAQWISGLVGVLLWIASLNVVAYFGTGKPLVDWGDSSETKVSEIGMVSARG